MVKLYNLNVIISLFIILTMIGGAALPTVIADTNKIYVDGFEKGISWKPYIPLKRTTFVQFDEESYIDDYAYLAAVPTAVFYGKIEDKIFSNPLLFYQDEYLTEVEKERTLNARQGLDYFMDDWMEYSNDQLDQMTLINVPKNKVDQWRANEYVLIEGDSPYDIACDIALNDWSYSDDAVIAVIEGEYEQQNEITTGETTGAIPIYDADHRTYEMQLPSVGIGGTYHSFDINDKNYKYIVTRMTWKDRMDWDLQLFDDQLGMVQSAMGTYSSTYPYSEVAASYIHNYGKWEISISAVPKKGPFDSMGKMESMYYESATESTGILSLFKKNTIDVNVDLYPGIELDIMGSPFGCRDVDISLKWRDPGVNLGLTVLDPVGTEIACSVSERELLEGKIEGDETKNVELKLDRLGECWKGENYSVCVFALNDVSSPIDFTVEYSWNQNFSKKEGDCLASATNGAILSSVLNAPLFYTSPSSLSGATEDVLYKLGVENIYLVNLGGHLSDDVKEEILDIADIKANYQDPRDVYDAIREITDHNDIIFTTIDPWNYWYIDERKSAGKYPGAHHIGPAAYVAAHHGSPVIIVDIHPRLSQAVTYPTDWWSKNAVNRYVEPSSGSMLMSGKRAYEFLEEYGFGKVEDGDAARQDHEVIITVAGQFQIGTPWDRSFTGAALPGRFWGSPVDTTYAICRNMFYPAMIFVNPGMEKVTLTQGSSSRNELILGRIKPPRGVTLHIYKPMAELEFQYPVLQTYNTYQYRFNEKASEHWDFKYTRADRIIPYVTPSPDPIDDGAAITKSGAYYPDQSESEVIPHYADKAGYSNCFSTNFDYVIKNLNTGILIWVVNSHGGFIDGGVVGMWDPDSPYIYEENPWRAYEPVMWKPGHLRTYLHWLPHRYNELLATIDKEIPLLEKISKLRPIKFQLFPEIGSTDNPDVVTLNPQLIYTNKIWKPLSLILHHDIWGALGIMFYRDRIKQPLKTLSERLPFINIYQGDGKVTHSPVSGHGITHRGHVGVDFDDALDNLHSCGINTISCLPANTYLHLTWMRHGSTYQIIDPWTTTDWASSWTQLLIKRFAMGDTLGEAYERGMRACGQELLVGQFWWDVWENVCLFGDPNLRVFVPDTKYSEANYWEREDIKPLRYDKNISINGHMPFGADRHPNAREPSSVIGLITWIVIIIAILSVAIIGGIVLIKKKRR
ncbi:MAG: hypothetical protein JSW06_09150 [Thermoplasmatales archaeon]|nr:MAG: hypothetical protein JSW06_09150 [Thermoplasmatales archaeon]